MTRQWSIKQPETLERKSILHQSRNKLPIRSVTQLGIGRKEESQVQANGLELSIETAEKVSGLAGTRLHEDTRTSSYEHLRKRHNYGRRGSEPSALAHVGRALNDELDTVRRQENGRDREACTFYSRGERKNEWYPRARARYGVLLTAYPFSPRFLSRSPDKPCLWQHEHARTQLFLAYLPPRKWRNI